MTPEEADQRFTRIHLRSPTLDNNMRPAMQLDYGKECPLGRDGACYVCDKFVGFISEDGVIAAYKNYDGWCDTRSDLEHLAEEGK